MGEIDDSLEIAEAGLVVERKDDGVVLEPHDLVLGYGRYQRPIATDCNVRFPPIADVQGLASA